jgi:hypothetical protein
VGSNYRQSLTHAAQAVENLSPLGGFAWFGSRRGHLSARVRRCLPNKILKEYVQETLAGELYHNYYIWGHARPAKDDQSDWAMNMGVTPFVQRLIEANNGTGTVEYGWSLVGKSDSTIVVSRDDGLQLWVSERESIVKDPDSDHRMGLGLPKHYLGRSPGHYIALGDKPLRLAPEDQLTRVYLNVAAASAQPLVKILTQVLNTEKIPFSLKVLSEPSRYGRGDSAVLYVRRTDFEAIRKVISQTLSVSEIDFLPLTPALTKRLAPGIGLAEDPGNGRSFGQHRCGLIAEGLVEAAANNAQSNEGKIGYVDAVFRSNGLDLEVPFLAPGARDIYQPIRAEPGATKGRSHKKRNPGSYLDQASLIGRAIVTGAVWYHTQCNWVGASPHGDAAQVRGITYIALGPDLYNGSSGIGLFLGDLGAATGEKNVIRTAAAALRHSLRFDQSRLIRGYWGAFTGWTGIALAGARCGAALNSDELVSLTRDYVRSAIVEVAKNAELDIMSGLAGGLVALLALQRYLRMEELVGLMHKLGKILLNSLDGSNDCRISRVGKIGMAHGASGIGFALMELYRATADERLLSTALQVFAHEREWLQSEGNWFDRFQDESSQSVKRLPSSWCSGATGIALTRAAAWHFFQDEICRRDALNALRAVRLTIARGLSAGSENFSLCHGLAGNAEALRLAGSSGMINAADGQGLPESVADYGIEQYSEGKLASSCGCAGQTPGLMLGLAGFGQFYLRMHSGAMPSPMLIPEQA